MPKTKTALAGLIVLCLTLLCGLWMVRDTLCDIHYQDDHSRFEANFVVYETVK
ncbi:TPA: Hok/Gef family protein [Vibrio parahaemolyticus]|nr:Hok/Gef family protein [Vibrio parahaemolyticus]